MHDVVESLVLDLKIKYAGTAPDSIRTHEFWMGGTGGVTTSEEEI